MSRVDNMEELHQKVNHLQAVREALQVCHGGLEGLLLCVRI